jgi:anaerobic ribonucleoside-triphosphate reductase activating protein
MSRDEVDDTFLLRDAPLPSRRDGAVRIGAVQSCSTVAGPGRRAVVWVSGCMRRCPGCIKPELLDFNAGRDIAVEDLAEQLLALSQICGVTFSGGEPFEQAVSLGRLAQMLRRRGLNIMSYSGYRLEVLQASPDRFGALLSQLDLLIDGEYRPSKAGPLLWRGSSNQRVHRLTPVGEEVIAAIDLNQPLRQIQLTIGAGGLRLSGFPRLQDERALSLELARRGIHLEQFQRESDPC